MEQQYRAALSNSRPLEECATQIQALVRGFLTRKDNFVIEVRPRIGRYSSMVSALTVEGFSTRSICSYQDDLEDEHPGFEGSCAREDFDFASPIRKPRRIASRESNCSSLFHTGGGAGGINMLTVVEDDEQHPGFDSPNSDEEPVRRPQRILSKESVDDFLFSPTTVDAACSPKKRSKKKNLSEQLLQIQEMPFSRGQKALARRERPKDIPAVLPIRHRSDASKEL